MNYFKFVALRIGRVFKKTRQVSQASNHDRILEIKNEEEMAEIAIENARIKAMANKPFKERLQGTSDEAYKPQTIKMDIVSSDTIAHVREIEFVPVVSATESKNPKRKKRKITFLLKTNRGETLYRGRKLSTFMKESGLDKKFSYSSAFHFAERYQGKKVFKGEYLISFTEAK